MGCGKNRKKSWKKLPAFLESNPNEDDDKDVNPMELKEIEKANNKSRNNSIVTNSTCKAVVKKIAKKRTQKGLDKKTSVWDDEIPISKKHKIQIISTEKSNDFLIHSGMSYNPSKVAHADLLSKIEKVEKRNIAKEAKLLKKLSYSINNEVEIDDNNETEEIENAEVVLAKPNKELGKKEKLKRKLREYALEVQRKEKKKSKEMEIMLNNIPKIKKAMKRELNDQEKSRIKAQETKKKRQIISNEEKSLKKIDVLLPEELPSSLRSLPNTGDVIGMLFGDLDIGMKQNRSNKIQKKRNTKSYKKNKANVLSKTVNDN